MAIPAVLLATAVLARLVILALYPFDGLYGQDAYAYFDYAGTLRSAIEAGRAWPEFFWPAGYPLHVVAASWVLGMTPLAGQATSVLAGALAALATYALAREAGAGRGGSALSGLVVALAAQPVISSLSIMADAVALAWASASAWLVLRYARTRAWWLLPAASCALGVAVITRWGYAPLALAWVLCVLAAWRAHWAALGWTRALGGAAPAVLLGGALVASQLLSGSHSGDLQVYGWDPLNALRRDVVNADGVLHYPLPTGLFYAQPLVHPSYIFPLLVPLWVAGLWWLATRAGTPVRVLLLAWPAGVYAFLAGVTWQNPRFALAFLPALAVWCGLGLDWLWNARPAWRRAVALLAAIALAGAFAWSVRTAGQFVERNKDEPLAAASYVAGRLAPRAVVYTFQLTLTMRHYTGLQVLDLFEQDPRDMQARVCAGEAVFVFVDEGNIRSQWQGRSPDMNLLWLREHANLEQIGAYGAYSLFRAHARCGSSAASP